MEYDGKQLLDACEICIKYNFKKNIFRPEESDGCISTPSYINGCDCHDGSVCLNKDRAIIVLLDRLLKKMDE